jgi:hypothetical protein
MALSKYKFQKVKNVTQKIKVNTCLKLFFNTLVMEVAKEEGWFKEKWENGDVYIY